MLALLAVQILFGLLPVAGKVAMSAYGAGGVACARVVGGAVAFWGLCRALGVAIPAWEGGRVLACALLGIVANQTLYIYGLQRTAAVHATMIVTLVPVVTYAVAVAAGAERLSGRRALGIVAGLSGALLLVAGDLEGGAWLGDLMVLGNTVSYAVYLVLARPILARYSPLGLIAAVFVWAVPVTTAIVWLSGDLPSLGAYLAAPAGQAGQDMGWASDPRAALLFVVLGPTIGTYYLNLYALQRVPPSTVALFIYLQPLISAASALAVLGEAPEWQAWAAGGLSAAGVWLASRREGASGGGGG